MILTCKKCQRAHPAEAVYCYFDGSLLPGHGQSNGGPVHVGSRAFPAEFVFPSGRRCRNFDELSLGCFQEWTAAVDLLQGGYLESFLGGIGRADLAMTARQAAKFPDRDRGLDMLIEKIPSQVVDLPKLHVEPLAINLGQLRVGQDHRFDLHLANQGMRLLYGTITVEKTGWLAIGDKPGVPEKGFDCAQEQVIPIQVIGKRMKSGAQALEGKILIESNGGRAEIIVKVDVPVKAFPSGILAGARTQRQLAEQAFKNPKESSPYFESGEVARWYADNGWTYPVQGPSATGIAALQQFLEACGLTQPPRVEMDVRPVELRGSAGAKIEHTFKVRAIDKKPVYAFIHSDQNWIVPKPAVLTGTTASVTVEIPSVPYTLDNETLAAKLTVTANGRQRFLIPVRLHVKGSPFKGPPAPIPVAAINEPITLFAEDESEPKAVAARSTGMPGWIHMMPLVLLLLVLGGVMIVDKFRKSSSAVETLEPVENLDHTPYLRVEFTRESSHQFGINRTVSRGKMDEKLTYSSDGKSNNTCVKIDGSQYLFGFSREGPSDAAPEHRGPSNLPVEAADSRAWKSERVYPRQQIRITQDVSLRRSDVTRKLDTCLVRYTIKNEDNRRHSVGLRFMLDTYIGANDGVPFTIPGRDGLCDTMQEFRTTEEIPDFIQALEFPDLRDPGTVALVTLKVPDAQGRLEPPNRVFLGAWPNHHLSLPGAEDNHTRWEVPQASMQRYKDSCVVMYWNEKELSPGETRELAFAYGLGKVSSSGQSGKLGVSVVGSFRPGGEFTVTGYVANPTAGQKAKLDLPNGLRLADDKPAERQIERSSGSAYSPVTWKVRAEREGTYEISVSTGGDTAKQKVRITTKSFLD